MLRLLDATYEHIQALHYTHRVVVPREMGMKKRRICKNIITYFKFLQNKVILSLIFSPKPNINVYIFVGMIGQMKKQNI